MSQHNEASFIRELSQTVDRSVMVTERKKLRRLYRRLPGPVSARPSFRDFVLQKRIEKALVADPTLLTIDGVSVVSGSNTLLVKNQAMSVNNGVYESLHGSWSRKL